MNPRMHRALFWRIFIHVLQINLNSFHQNSSECAHMGVKAFKFERTALALDFEGWAFFGHNVFTVF